MLALKREEAAPVERAPELQTLIGKGCVFEGKLTFEGMVRIDGQFRGQIHTRDTLIVSAGANVQADITAGTVIIYGAVEGNVAATVLVEIHTPARMRGNLETPALSIEKGVIFEGSCKMESLKEKAAPPPLPERRNGKAEGGQPQVTL